MIKVRATNFVGVSKADVEAEAIVLVGGVNAAGKSSLLQGVAAAMCGDALVRGLNAKKEALALVHDGKGKATVEIEMEDGGLARMSWPSCEYESIGRAPQGHPLAVGLAKLTDLDAKERRRALYNILGADPTRADLADALGDGIGERIVNTLWERIEQHGWDGALKKTQERGAALKGQWEATTKEHWGEKKADDWTPPGFSARALESASAESLAQDI